MQEAASSVAVQQDNPFGSRAIAAQKANAVAETDQQRAIAETQAAMIIAKRFPRDPAQAVDRILMACTRPTLAEQALYSYGRGGTDVTGPSIRMAEALAQNWGNIQFGIRELEQRDGESSVEAYAWDIETNTRQVKVFQVPHIRYTRNGTKKLEDPRDVYEMVANQGARRLRACILGVIPGDVIEAAVKQCETTLKTKAEVTPERLAALVEKFAEYSVTKEMIEKRIQRRLDAMTPALLVNLGKIYNSMKDGMSAPADWFEIAPPSGDPAPAGGEAPKKGADALREAAKNRKSPTGATAPTSSASTAAAKHQPPKDDRTPADKVADRIQKARDAKDTEVAFLILDEVRSMIDDLPDAEREALRADLAAASDEIKARSQE